MQCLRPISVPNIDGLVPCGTCAACLKTRADHWYIRLNNEMQHSKNAFFVTLTYNTDNLPSLAINDYEIEEENGSIYLSDYVRGDYVNAVPTLYKPDAQAWIKRLRKYCEPGLKYYTVGEYGGKFGRPHYHSILFHVKPYNIEQSSILPYMLTLVNNTWNMGNATVEPITGGAIKYVTDYICEYKKEDDKYAYKDEPFALMSKRIGEHYLRTHEKYHKTDTKRFYHTAEDGVKRSLPRYYRDKFYNKHIRAVHAAKMQIETDKIRKKKKERFEAKNNIAYERYEMEINKDFEKQRENKLKRKGK